MIRARSLRPLTSCLLLMIAAPACFPLLSSPGAVSSQGNYEAALASAQKSTDDQLVARLEAARAKVRQSPGGVDEARVLAQNVLAVHELKTVERAHLDGPALVQEAISALDAAVAAHPDQKAEAMFSKGGMLLSAGKADEGVAALRASMDAKASPSACVSLIAELDKRGDPDKEILPLCQKARPSAADDETKFALLQSCLTHSHAGDVEAGLKWAGSADIAFYKDYQQKIAAENAAHRREQEEQSARMRAEMDANRARDDQRRKASESAGRSAGASGSAMFSLTLHNSCSKTVKLFFGREPKFGSGTYSSLGGNNVTSYTGQAGDMIWIVDDNQKGVSSLSPSGSQNMQITSSCSGFAPY